MLPNLHSGSDVDNRLSKAGRIDEQEEERGICSKKGVAFLQA